jgi:hypothetical protein
MFDDEVLVTTTGLRDLTIALRCQDISAAEEALDRAVTADDDAAECVARARASTAAQVAA